MTAKSDLIGGALWALFGALILIAALRMDTFESMGATFYTRPGLVPAIFGGILIALGLALSARSFSKKTATSDNHASAPEHHDGQPNDQNKRVAITLALCLLYALVAIGRVHFIPSSGVFIAVFAYLFAPDSYSLKRKVVMAGIVGFGTATTIGLVFEKIFLVRLP